MTWVWAILAILLVSALAVYGGTAGKIVAVIVILGMLATAKKKGILK